jgi:hypothetical protein
MRAPHGGGSGVPDRCCRLAFVLLMSRRTRRASLAPATAAAPGASSVCAAEICSTYGAAVTAGAASSSTPAPFRTLSSMR